MAIMHEHAFLQGMPWHIGGYDDCIRELNPGTKEPPDLQGWSYANQSRMAVNLPNTALRTCFPYRIEFLALVALWNITTTDLVADLTHVS